jgi:hypothetical protein
VQAVTPRTASEVLEELLRSGYTLSVQTRSEVHDHKVGARAITCADQLYVEGPQALSDDLRAEIKANRDELLAAACVIRPPVPWMRVLVERYRTGEAVEVRREGWTGPYLIRLGMVAANVAGFIGLHPANDGPRLEPIIEEVLR